MAAGAAVEIGRMRDYIRGLVQTRQILKAMLGRVKYFPLIPPVAYVITVGFFAWQATLAGASWQTFVLQVALISAHAVVWVAVGCLAGMIMPLFAAIPLALIVPYTFYILPSGLPISPLQYVLGYPPVCCAMEQRYDASVAWAGFAGLFMLTMFGFYAFGILGKHSNRSVVRQVGLIVIATAAFSVSWQQAAASVQTAGVVERSASELVCEQQVCAWPENDAQQVIANQESFAELQARVPELLQDNATVSVLPATQLSFAYTDDAAGALWFYLLQLYAQQDPLVDPATISLGMEINYEPYITAFRTDPDWELADVGRGF
ncbi:MAG: hypothetical protein Q3976_04340 [Corynebacterium sp.]|nr:hypothetical protein [Corynebacterium sp.]